MAGGKSAVDVNDEMVIEAAEAAVAKLNEESNSLSLYGVHRVVSGTKQVVAGLKFDLTIEVKPSTNCYKGNDLGKLCTFNDAKVTSYDVSVVVQPWQDESNKFQVKIHA